MGSDLLKKEEEYYKLNLELETKTKELMQEVDMVMKIQDNIVNEPILDPKAISRAYINKYETKPKQPHEWNSTAIESFSVQDDIVIPGIPESVNEMGYKGMSHFYKAKVKRMQEDIDKLQAEYRTKVEEVRKLQKENQKLNEDKDKWFQLSTSNKTHISKLENQISVLHSKLQAKDNEKANLKKENEQLQKELKSLTANSSCTELRLNRANEECEKLKLAFKTAKQEEKDLRENHRKEINDMTSIIRKIEKHRNELLTGFKKQLQLIDNLKRQKAHIECYKLGETAEAEFMKILEWKMDP